MGRSEPPRNGHALRSLLQSFFYVDFTGKCKGPGFLFASPAVHFSLSDQQHPLAVENSEISDKQKGENGITRNLRRSGNVVDAFPSRLFFPHLKTEHLGALRTAGGGAAGEAPSRVRRHLNNPGVGVGVHRVSVAPETRFQGR